MPLWLTARLDTVLCSVENSGEITISASLTTTLRISGHNLATGVLSLSRGFIDANMSNDGTIEMNDLVSGRIVFNGGSNHKVDCGILDCPLLEIVSMPAPPPSPGSPPSPAPPPPGYRELFYTDSTCETPYTGGFYESHGGGSHHRRALQEATHTINTWTQLHLPENSCCQKHCPGGCTGVVFNEYVYERCGANRSATRLFCLLLSPRTSSRQVYVRHGREWRPRRQASTVQHV